MTFDNENNQTTDGFQKTSLSKQTYVKRNQVFRTDDNDSTPRNQIHTPQTVGG